MKTNLAAHYPAPLTHEGGPADRIGPEQELRRTVAACLLWEDSFYESGVSIADRIKVLVPQCRTGFVAAVAYEARTMQKLRHVPLLVVREMARCVKHQGVVGKLLPDIIQRADELSEFVSLYWATDPRGNQAPLSKQVKLGLLRAFGKFDEYALAKYNRDGAVKLRDVLFLCHAKPKDAEQAALWKRLVDGKLATPDTWEVNLSAGEDKKTTWERLMVEGKLGAMAFLRNLRNMKEVGISKEMVATYASLVDIKRVLPFRFLAAARALPEWEDVLESMMLSACEGQEKLLGRTLVLLDVSGSMDNKISAKSDLMRLDAACGVGVLLREVCEDVNVVTFSDALKVIAPRHGFALRDAIVTSQAHRGTLLGAAVAWANTQAYDRIVVLTDEQSADAVGSPISGSKAYMVNVASDKNGVSYGKGWRHVDGWSETVIDYIRTFERIEEWT